MTKKVKIICYVVLAIAGLWCGFNFVRAYSKATAAKPAPTAIEPGADLPKPQTQSGTGMMGYAAGFLAVVVCLALLIAFDFSGFFADRFEKLVFDEEGEGQRDPEYEEAEKVWANGHHLEAIRLMREFLEAHPTEQYAALRIAEIYEKDLGNHVAAALEYEEILKKRLPPDRWGRAAIHLANLYSGKLNRADDATALLRRIISEYPQTAAARKAREHLGEPEPAPPAPEAAASDTAPSNLPPGFRPK